MKKRYGGLKIMGTLALPGRLRIREVRYVNP